MHHLKGGRIGLRSVMRLEEQMKDIQRSHFVESGLSVGYTYSKRWESLAPHIIYEGRSSSWPGTC